MISQKNKDILQKWGAFRNDLPHQKGEMAKRNWGHPWHSMCSYQGKLKPAIANTLVEAVVPSGEMCRVLDPFSGVGTIPFEARLAGHQAYGFDISPAAVIISQAKLCKPNIDAVRQVIDNLEEWIAARSNKNVPDDNFDWMKFNGPLREYFNPETYKEVISAREFFLNSCSRNSETSLVMACLLHILHGNRPYALSRRSHPITPFSPSGPSEYRSLIPRLKMKVDRILSSIPNVEYAPSGHIYTQDVTLDWPAEVDKLDAIITSPPFFDSTRFHTANWMRLWFSGWGLEEFSNKPKNFVDERQKRSFSVYETIFKQSADRLKSGGVMVLHLGKSKKCDMASILVELGQKYLKLEDNFSESVAHCESHGIRDKGTVTHHQYLLFMRS